MIKTKRAKHLSMLFSCMMLFTACGSDAMDDYATNQGYEVVSTETGEQSGIPKEDIKVGVLHITDPAEGSGYTYTHDIGIQGMQENLGLTDDQIVRKINVDDSDEEAITKALQECVDEGCNIIFTTSWGYMQPTADMAEKYPEIYFSHGTGYLSNGKNFNNYFGRIYQAR